jgi:hypothetical protein
MTDTPHGLEVLRTYGEGFAGRQAELKALDQAWNEGTRIFVLHAEGGAGKTRVVAKWLTQISDDGYSLMLLGTYLRDATNDHEIRRRHQIPLLAEDSEHRYHARHRRAGGCRGGGEGLAGDPDEPHPSYRITQARSRTEIK